jgi:uncharacterized membrane protein
MPQIESQIEMDAPLSVVWPMAQDIANYPAIMPDMEDVKVLSREERGDGAVRVVSEWQAIIRQMKRKVQWVEEDIWSEAEGTCHFWQLRGDFTEYGGDYTFKEIEGKTHVRLKLNYRFDIPLLGALMQKVIQKLMQDNIDGMLLALKAEAEKRAANA